MKIYFIRLFNKPISFIFLIPTLIFLETNLLNAQDDILKEMKSDSSTKLENNSSVLPTNPFEIMQMIRKANSLNNATKPSDAIDDALKSFITIDRDKKL